MTTDIESGAREHERSGFNLIHRKVSSGVPLFLLVPMAVYIGSCKSPNVTYSEPRNRSKVAESGDRSAESRDAGPGNQTTDAGSQTFESTPLNGNYVIIPSGTFTKGSKLEDPESTGWTDPGEPRSKEEIPYRLAAKRTEVTQGEWKDLLGSNPSRFDNCGDDCPVESVNWYEALVYVNQLSTDNDLRRCYRLKDCTGVVGAGCHEEQSKQFTCYREVDCRNQCQGRFRCKSVEFRGPTCEGYRLPTDTEWEYLARADTTTHTYAGDYPSWKIFSNSQSCLLANIAVHSHNNRVSYSSGEPCGENFSKRCGTRQVGSLRPNDFGLYDMLGNVAEWTSTREYKEREILLGGALGGFEARLVRGCSWRLSSVFCRSAERLLGHPRRRGFDRGFRPVRTIQDENVP